MTSNYLKFAAQVGVTALAAIMTALADGHMTASEWVNVVILALGSAAVLGAGELPEGVWSRAKTYVAAATAGAVVLQSVITGGVTPVEWMQIALAVFGALGVHVVPGPTVAASCPPASDPADQIRGGLAYIRDRYPAPMPKFDTTHWYDAGGVVPPGATVVRNDSDDDELVQQWDADFAAWKNRQDHADDTQEIPRVTETVQRIPEQVVEGKRLGRHVRHDPRSLNYLVPETDTPVTKIWQRRVPVFDQGNLGSCTGNAAAGVLGTDPFYSTLPSGLTDDEKEAVSLYSAATKLDGYQGSYPPDDTGSDGLSVAKAAQKAGLISGYQHITSVAAAQTAIKSGPFIVGTNWHASMDNPDANGLVKVSGAIRGGHEYECFGYDAEADLWWFCNSWGTGWGKEGTFCMSSASFGKLLAEQGDATVFLPIAAPFPPAPPVPPGPTPAPTGFPLAAYEEFRKHHYSRPKVAAFIAACDAWLSGGGA